MGIKPLLFAFAALATIPATAVMGGQSAPILLPGKAAITEDHQYGFDNRPREIFHEICRLDLKPHNPLTESEPECRDWATYVERVSLNDVNVEYDFKPVNTSDIPTRQSARRFYEWNPPTGPGTGSVIAAHIFQDIETFRYATPEHQQVFRNYCPGTEPQCANIPVVYLANEDSWVDALGASYGANAAFNGNRAPGDMLLTNGDHLSQEVIDALNRIQKRSGKPGRVHLVGGTTVLAPAIEQTLTQMGWQVTRSGGLTRVETIINMRPTASKPIAGGKHFVTLVRGFAQPGSSESGAYADAVNVRFEYSDIYVTNTDHLPDVIAADLMQASADGQLFGWANSHALRIYGGTQAVSDRVVNTIVRVPTRGTDRAGRPAQIGFNGINRIAGATRFHTAAQAVRNGMPESPRWAKALVLVDGEREDLFKTAFPARSLTNVAYVQGDTIPAPTRSLLRDFGRPDRDMVPAPEHRMVFCYASAAACAQAREILYTG
ncbi:cell wall-binding repeat-containing protein [Stomatohabitans albus]|uniref:cell wall-binding repeat-containing protein n=1 Tax=Stomatohabitans albus TaxID=3110766 RepID=UPI00300DAFC2